jgi:hypothetical protein
MAFLSGLEHILGDALAPLQEADRLLGEAVEGLGTGVTFAGDEAHRMGEFIEGLEAKIQALRSKLATS